MSMLESEIEIGRTYEGRDWRTHRQVVDIEKEPGRFGSTYVIYTSVEEKPRRGKKYLSSFAFEASNMVEDEPAAPKP